MKILVLLNVVTISLYANNINELYIKASKYEKQHEYKKAMDIYKQIASKSVADIHNKAEVNILSHEKPEQHKVSNREKFINTLILEPIKDKETRQKTEQLFTSSFDIYAYKANYFLPLSYDTKKRSDREQSEAKFQISLKKPLFYNLFGLNESINVAYTQTSWWQIYSDSSPFRETNYQPEVFITIPYEKGSPLKAYKFAFIHESNGQGGNKSRSWNRLYLETFFQYDSLFVIPKVWYRIPEDDENDDNSDISHYLGYGDLSFLYVYKRNTFKLKLRNNLNFSDNKNGAELEHTFPLSSQKKGAYGFIQIYSGYGESLIDYDTYMNKISIGFSISM